MQLHAPTWSANVPLPEIQLPSKAPIRGAMVPLPETQLASDSSLKQTIGQCLLVGMSYVEPVLSPC